MGGNKVKVKRRAGCLSIKEGYFFYPRRSPPAIQFSSSSCWSKGNPHRSHLSRCGLSFCLLPILGVPQLRENYYFPFHAQPVMESANIGKHSGMGECDPKSRNR